MSIKFEQQTLIMSITDAKEMFDTLKDAYEPQSRARMASLRRKSHNQHKLALLKKMEELIIYLLNAKFLKRLPQSRLKFPLIIHPILYMLVFLMKYMTASQDLPWIIEPDACILSFY